MCSVLAWDDVVPSKSRLKIYFTTPHTSFKSVREVVTMGGLLEFPEHNLQDLRLLICAILGLPDDYPEDEQVPSISPDGKRWKEFDALVEGFVYFFDVAPRNNKPDVKFYLPTRKYGSDDLSIAQSLVDWMGKRGRGAYAAEYIRMLDSLAEHRGLNMGKGMHTYISYQLTSKGEPDVKSYLCPEIYHPARYST